MASTASARNVQPIESALRAVFSDFDAGRFAEVAKRLTPDAQMADELTGEWLRGRDEVTRYLRALQATCSEVNSCVTSMHAWWIERSLGAATFMVHQRYRLGADAREERLAGTALFHFNDAAPELLLLHLGPTAAQVRITDLPLPSG